MRVEIERREIKAQTDAATIDLSQPFGHVLILEAVVYGDDGKRVEGAIEACDWFRNATPVNPDPMLGECRLGELRVDMMRGTETPGCEDLYRAAVTLKD